MVGLQWCLCVLISTLSLNSLGASLLATEVCLLPPSPHPSSISLLPPEPSACLPLPTSSPPAGSVQVEDVPQTQMIITDYQVVPIPLIVLVIVLIVTFMGFGVAFYRVAFYRRGRGVILNIKAPQRRPENKDLDKEIKEKQTSSPSKPEQDPDEGIKEKLKSAGLDPSSWLAFIKDDLKMSIPEEIGEEFYQDLAQYVRKAGEKKREELEKAEAMLQQLRELEKHGSDRHESAVENGVHEVLKTPPDAQQEEDKPLDEDEKKLSQVENYLAGIDDQRHRLKESMKPKSTVWADLEKMYPNDLEAAKPLQWSKDLLDMEMKNFEQECLRKVKDYSAVFGPQEFEQDLNKFLKKLSKELEQTFNGTCAFSGLHTVIMNHAAKTDGVVEVMRNHAQQLCTTLGLSPVHIPAEAGEEEGSSTIPILGSIKDKIDIPPVTFWSRVMQFFNNLFIPDFWRKPIRRSKGESTNCKNSTDVSGDRDESDEVESDHTASAAKQRKLPSYRFWDKELKKTMEKLRKNLEAECKDYLHTNIKQKVLKYFHDQYCRKTTAQLQAFDMDFKAKINEARQRLQELEEKLESNTCKMTTVVKLQDHLLQLKAHLCTKADEY